MAMVLTMVLCLVSCEDEEYACRPVYGKIHSIPSVIFPGDSVTIEADVNYPGHRIYKAEYTWKTTNFNQTVTVIAGDGEKTITTPPQLTWVPKSTGSFRFSMSAKLYYSMPDSIGSLFGNASAVSSTIKVTRRE